MRQLNGIYTQRFNRRHDRIGHLFQGRFKSILIEKDPHLLELIRYVVLNPVRAGLVARPEGWHWSNFRATAALVRPPRWLEIDWTLSQFGGGAFASDRYRQFVHAGLDKSATPWVNLKMQIFLGGDAFRRRRQERIDRGSRSEEIPWTQRHCVRPTFVAIVRAVGSEFDAAPALLLQRRRSPVRLAAAYLARHDGGLALRDFAAALGVKRWAASHLAIEAERLVAESPVFRRRIDRIRKVLKQTHTLRDLTP